MKNQETAVGWIDFKDTVTYPRKVAGHNVYVGLQILLNLSAILGALGILCSSIL